MTEPKQAMFGPWQRNGHDIQPADTRGKRGQVMTTGQSPEDAERSRIIDLDTAQWEYRYLSDHVTSYRVQIDGDAAARIAELEAEVERLKMAIATTGAEAVGRLSARDPETGKRLKVELRAALKAEKG